MQKNKITVGIEILFVITETDLDKFLNMPISHNLSEGTGKGISFAMLAYIHKMENKDSVAPGFQDLHWQTFYCGSRLEDKF